MLFLIPGILRKVGEYRFLLWSSGINALSLLLLSMLKNPIGIVVIFIFYFTLNNLIVFALDELVQIFSKNSKIGHVRGLYLTIINLAWVISQIISGKILFGFSFSSLYILTFVIMSVFFLISLLSLENFKDPAYDRIVGWQSFKKFFTNKNLVRAYKINFLLQFFYVWMVVYTPLYLFAHLGFSWKEIGIIFAIMLLPFVFIQYPLGKYSDQIGERKMLIFGFLIAAVATISLFFIQKHEVWIWAIALFTTRIGAAIIEVMSDVHFFKHINKENDELIAIYRNTASVAYIFAPIIAFVALSLVPSFNFIFPVLGIIMFYGVYLSSTIHKNDI